MQTTCGQNTGSFAVAGNQYGPTQYPWYWSFNGGSYTTTYSWSGLAAGTYTVAGEFILVIPGMGAGQGGTFYCYGFPSQSKTVCLLALSLQ